MNRIAGKLVSCMGYSIIKKTGLAYAITIILRVVYSCQASPGIQVGSGFKLGYGGLGCVLHGKCVLGNNVSVGPNVTIGGNIDSGGVPVIGNNVRISVGAKILGDIVIGDNSVVGANAVVLKDVEPNTVVGGIPAKVLRRL